MDWSLPRFAKRNKLSATLFASLIFTSALVSASPSQATTDDLSHGQAVISEPAEVVATQNVLSIYLDTFRPNNTIYFEVTPNPSAVTDLVFQGTPQNVAADQSFAFSLKSGATLNPSQANTPIYILKDSQGITRIQVFAVPSDFPTFNYTGSDSTISSKSFLMTDVMAHGTYAIATKGKAINFFMKSLQNLIGFRQLNDTVADPLPGGTPKYAYLVQQDTSVTATSPGTWILLDSQFNRVGSISSVSSKYGDYLSEGHGMTIAPDGSPVVINAVTRTVDTSWLKRPIKGAILDCVISEVLNGRATKSFSFWDWAVAHKSVAEPYLDSMPLFNDPQNPTSSPIDICHANSVEYYKPLNTYLFSLRSPSLVVLVDKNLSTITQVLSDPNALQHYARFVSPKEITALGNFTNAATSQLSDWKLVGGQWTLTNIPLPVHVSFCGNINLLTPTTVWLGGGCGEYKKNTLGTLYSFQNNTLKPIGTITSPNVVYSYRVDPYTP